MEAATNSSSSRVIVQCTDPANLLEVFEPRLSNRTPLRSLHWKSPNRPLRSIPSLDIAITRDDRPQDGHQSNTRRHQIPGLRETPYVKLYLLRCDDQETYKETARKEIRQWVKDNAVAKESKLSSKNQEQHDAAEWMIVHVVLPDTPASLQPKSSKHISLEATESTDSVNSKSKWTGKSSSTIYDKLRADFSSSKSQIGRVAQVRITESGRAQTSLSSAEIEEQWQDLIENLKASILNSFDTRVAQYEEDIRERDRQRCLPGWNFCTFFILKEGLARGFENVGLLDDALAVYNELEIGLDTLVKEQADQDDVEPSGALLLYSKDLKGIIRATIDSHPSESSGSSKDHTAITLLGIIDEEKDRFPFDVDKRNYRDLILSNEVSALDFRIYMFTREMEILLRQAKAPMGTLPFSEPMSKSLAADVDVVANLAESALTFINLASRELRSDLYKAWGGRLSGSELQTQRTVVGNVVTSWAWAAVMQILSRTLPAMDLDLEEFERSHLFSVADRTAPSSDDMGARISSPDRTDPRSAISSPQHVHSRQRADSTSRERNGVVQSGPKSTSPGSLRLAAWIARLLLLARTLLEELSGPDSCRSCTPAENSIESLSSTSINGSNNLNRSRRETIQSKENMKSLNSPYLRDAVSSDDSFYPLYLLLSKHAYRFLNIAKNKTAMQQVLIDLSQAAYHRGQYEVVASYVGGILDDLPQQANSQAQSNLLQIYADCLKRLDRLDDYCRCLLVCLQCSPELLMPDTTQQLVDELAKYANLVRTITLDFAQVFKISRIDQTISTHSHKDGFSLSMDIQSCFPAELKTTACLRLSLRAIDHDCTPELLIETGGNVAIYPNPVSVEFFSTVSTQGWYELNTLEMEVGNLHFLHHFNRRDTAGPPGEIESGSPARKTPSVLLYPRANSLSLKMMPATVIVLGEPRRLAVKLYAGANEIKSCSIRLRSATAGLRLQVHNAILRENSSPTSLSICRENDNSFIECEGLPIGGDVEIEVPYTMENYAESSLKIKTEVNYEIEDTTFTQVQSNNVDILLPISVNVQDFYRESWSFSRFSITPATLVPISLVDCAVEGGEAVEVETGSEFTSPITVFPKQPASWMIRITKQHTQHDDKAPRLELIVSYRCIDELILHALGDALTDEITNSPYNDAAQLLRSHMLARVKGVWTEQDLEVASLMQEIEIWHMEELEWRTVLGAFKPDIRPQILGWLQSWHENRGPIRLTPEKAPLRKLRLHVDLPASPPIIVTELKIHDHRAAGSVIVCQPLFAELVIQASLDGDTIITDNPDIFDLTYELYAPTDAWLIGGRKKGNFPPSNVPIRLEMVLFPQRVGTILLPVIDIRYRRKDGKNARASEGWVDVPIEIRNKSLSKSVVVMSGLESVSLRVSVEEGLSSGGGFVTDGLQWAASDRGAG